MPEFIQIPTPGESQRAQDQAKLKIRAPFDYAWEREQQLVKQRNLLETLRYRKYERDGSLWGVMQRIGDWGRAEWLWLLVYAYVIYRFTRLF